MDISALMYKMVLIFFAIACGFAAGKANVIDDVLAKKLSRVVIYVTNPLLILYSVLGGEHVLDNGQVLLLTLIATLGFGFLILCALGIPRLLGVRGDRKTAGMYEFMFVFSNLGYLGYPVVAALFGEQAIFYATIFVIPFNILCFTYGIYVVSGRKKGAGISVRSLFQPVIIAALLTYVLYLLDVRAPALLTDCVGYVGNITTPLTLLILGSTLSRIPLRSVIGDMRLYCLSFIKLVVLPIVVYFIVRGFIKNEMMCGITVVMMAMPIATNSTMVALEYGGDHKTASAGVFLSTILSLVTIPLVMWLLFVKT